MSALSLGLCLAIPFVGYAASRRPDMGALAVILIVLIAMAFCAPYFLGAKA